MSAPTLARMKNFHDAGAFWQALDGSRGDPWPVRDGQQDADRGDAQDIGASDKNWQQLLQVNDFWRYL